MNHLALAALSLSLVLAYAATSALPALAANSLVLADLAATTLNAHVALSLTKLTCRGPMMLQVRNKKAGVGAEQDAEKRAESTIVTMLLCFVCN